MRTVKKRSTMMPKQPEACGQSQTASTKAFLENQSPGLGGAVPGDLLTTSGPDSHGGAWLRRAPRVH